MSKILIIGNGFDLNLGLKTKYSDFLQSLEFKKLRENPKNFLFRYLDFIHEQARQPQQWVDIEHELKEYANLLALQNTKFSESDFGIEVCYYLNTQQINEVLNSNRVHIKQHFTNLKEALQNYLDYEITTFKRNTQSIIKTQSYKLLRHGYLRENPSEDQSYINFDQIYTFNYTNALDLIGFSESRFAKNTQIFHMHGSIKSKNIVFGVEDGSVPIKYAFLNKSFHAAFGNCPDIADAILEANEVHFFGCSLGKTDDAHFKYPFQALSQRREKNRKTQLYFYTFGSNGYQEIINRILSLTDNRLSEFKITNDVFFYDLESSQLIDQQWINNL